MNYAPPGRAIATGQMMIHASEHSPMNRATVPVVGLAPPARVGVEPFRPGASHGTAGEGEARPACEGRDPELFFSNDPGDRAEARRACLACPRRQGCLDDALEADQRWGVFGGLTASERRDLKSRRG